MNEDILEILYEQGPRSIEQLQSIILCDLDMLCEHLSFLILAHEVYLECDSTVWLAREAVQ
ncbi:hypothetical protein MYE70_10495 [Marinobacter alexandrii]|uniref:hypothetical protein n=1 Tax=Marinobacter alexandrii TaxID=2570351 RepID=UPI001FFE40DB|nr:hypothetical protein [Marinobacter alexandrii]MCK2149494.1 hypothetical protein [Marinobacter alexandrii]